MKYCSTVGVEVLDCLREEAFAESRCFCTFFQRGVEGFCEGGSYTAGTMSVVSSVAGVRKVLVMLSAVLTISCRGFWSAMVQFTNWIVVQL